MNFKRNSSKEFVINFSEDLSVYSSNYPSKTSVLTFIDFSSWSFRNSYRDFVYSFPRNHRHYLSIKYFRNFYKRFLNDVWKFINSIQGFLSKVFHRYHRKYHSEFFWIFISEVYIKIPGKLIADILRKTHGGTHRKFYRNANNNSILAKILRVVPRVNSRKILLIF